MRYSYLGPMMIYRQASKFCVPEVQVTEELHNTTFIRYLCVDFSAANVKDLDPLFASD